MNSRQGFCLYFLMNCFVHARCLHAEKARSACDKEKNTAAEKYDLFFTGAAPKPSQLTITASLSTGEDVQEKL